ncbi:MAG TPA: hypothetical protein VK933_04575 [Longimicrobiales bacterium]|nr:hypothetical protein [Longimicrobiales bacterium]
MSTMTTQRIDRLLRSLVGVSDVRMLWRAHTLRAVHILRDRNTQPHQLIRNIVSGLQAGFGVQLLPTQIHVHDDTAVFEALDVIGDVLSDDGIESAAVQAEVKRTGQPGNGGHGNGNGGAKAVGSAKGVAPNGQGTKPNGAARNGNSAVKDAAENGAAKRKANGAPAGARTHRDAAPTGTVVVRPSSAPAEIVAAAADLIARRPTGEMAEGLTLERIDVERRAGTLRCRTVLALGERRYSAIAEVPDSPSAEAELAARVAVDALRAGGLTTAMLDGVGFITIAKTNYCVATVREPGNAPPRAGAAPLIDSMAASATAAVLTALGSFTDARAQNRARAGH